MPLRAALLRRAGHVGGHNHGGHHSAAGAFPCPASLFPSCSPQPGCLHLCRLAQPCCLRWVSLELRRHGCQDGVRVQTSPHACRQVCCPVGSASTKLCAAGADLKHTDLMEC